ncbi:MAG: hypothetical protein ABI051_10415 [Vicinamibacterales bacterium]
MSRPTSCPREDEVMDVVSLGQWPDRADDELRRHATSCEVCRDLALVGVSLHQLSDVMSSEVRVPDASLVWRRSAMLARDEAAERASAPMLVAHVWAFVLLAVVGAAWLAGLIPASVVPALPSDQWWTPLGERIRSVAAVDIDAFADRWAGLAVVLRWGGVGLAALIVAAAAAWLLVLVTDKNEERPADPANRPA